ncbi:hypothetical protein ACFOW4_13290 [Micromonospora sp. GCM10011542]|uniref:hypothetical protein n=1 Tax=Micromonospora sp. GCM10011542 TaxID=3317337 RepID=UPI003615810B
MEAPFGVCRPADLDIKLAAVLKYPAFRAAVVLTELHLPIIRDTAHKRETERRHIPSTCLAGRTHRLNGAEAVQAGDVDAAPGVDADITSAEAPHAGHPVGGVGDVGSTLSDGAVKSNEHRIARLSWNREFAGGVGLASPENDVAARGLGGAYR